MAAIRNRSSPQAAGQLVGVPAALDDERGLDQVHGETAAHPQPQVVVLAGRQALVEEPHPLEELPPHHHRRGAHQAELERRLEDHPAPLAVPLAGVHPPSVLHPQLLGLTDEGLRMRGEEIDLAPQLARQPDDRPSPERRSAPPGRRRCRRCGPRSPRGSPDAAPGCASPYPSSSCGVSSVDPSSTTISSKPLNSCASTESTASARHQARL